MRPRASTGLAVIALVVGSLAASGGSTPVRDPALTRVLEGHDATMVVWFESDGRTVVHGPNRAARRVAPCSTFKIPNAVLALETGVATGPDHVRRFDPGRHLRQPGDSDRRWARLARDHDLASAIRSSVVWYFRDVAVEIGEDRMAAGLARFDYGNRDLSGGIDRFWLSSSLEISAEEQVAFLRGLSGGRLSDPGTTERIAGLLLQDEAPDGYAIHAKTGAGRTPDGRPLGWWVGWIDGPDGRVVFAFRMEADTFAPIFRDRVVLARRALAAVGALPPEAPP